MHDPDDVVRSIREYVAGMLGPPWIIDLERSDVPDDQRPAGLIEMGPARSQRARSAIDQGPFFMAMPVTVMLYPSLNPPRVAGRVARQLSHALFQLMQVGRDGIVFPDGRRACGPERVPLYDFADVPLVGTPEERAAPEFPYAVLWVEDFSAHPTQDPLDSQRWSVALELRVSWEVPGRMGDPAPIAVSTTPNPDLG